MSLGYPLYVNGRLFDEPVTISHVPANAPNGILGSTDPSMGALGAYVYYRPTMAGLGVTPEAAPQPLPMAPPSAYPQPGGLLRRGLALAGALSTAALAYHGYKRNDSIGWAIVWAIFGGGIPIIGWPVALGQGFGKPKRGLTPNRSKRRRRRGRSRRARKNPEDHPWDDDRRYAVIYAETLDELARGEIGRADIDPDVQGMKEICADYPEYASKIRALTTRSSLSLPNGDEIWRMR